MYGGSSARAATGMFSQVPQCLAHVAAHHLGQLEHRDLSFAAKEYFQLGIGIDHALILLVLQIVAADVIPDLLDDLSSWNAFASNYSSKSRTRSERSHEGCIRFSC